MKSTVARQPASKHPATSQGATRPPISRRLSEPILGLQGMLGNQAIQWRASACPMLALCPTGGACHECAHRRRGGSDLDDQESPPREPQVASTPNQTQSSSIDFVEQSPQHECTDCMGQEGDHAAAKSPAALATTPQDLDDLPGSSRPETRLAQDVPTNTPDSSHARSTGEQLKESSPPLRSPDLPAENAKSMDTAAPAEPAVDREPGESLSSNRPLQETAVGRSPSTAQDSGQPDSDRSNAPRPSADESVTSHSAVQPPIAEDTDVDLRPGQMKRSEFLSSLRTAVTATAERTLSGTGRSARDCPYIDYWFGFYSGKSTRYLLRAIRHYSPAAAVSETAEDVISHICEHVRTAVETWVQTGHITGVPEGVPLNLPGSAGEDASVSRSVQVLFKGREGGPRAGSDPQAIRSQLGSGRAMDGVARSRMESAFGSDFSGVRVHTDAKAATVADTLNARAFTIGNDIAFGGGEYTPGTPVGDALLAHELAHVVQQGRATDSPAQGGGPGYQDLEHDADQSSSMAVLSLWSRAKGGLAGFRQKAIPRLRSGVTMQRCSRSSPQLSASIDTGPTAGNCGDVNFIIKWSISANAAANGGYVVQDVNFRWSTKDCSDVPVPNPDPRTSPLKYYEAWRVAPNSKTLSPVSTDTFFWPGNNPWAGPSTKGNLSITATAKYHDNVASLPAHMIVNNPNTFAGGLWSSLTDPSLGGDVSAGVNHSLTTHWACCPGTNKTIIDGHDP